MRASAAAVVLGGSHEAAEAAPHRPPASLLAQVRSLARGSGQRRPWQLCHTHAATHERFCGPWVQVEAVARALPRAPVPANLLAQQALHDAAAEAAAAAGPTAPDCLEACCLRDDLHLFMCVGGALDSTLAPGLCCKPLHSRPLLLLARPVHPKQAQLMRCRTAAARHAYLLQAHGPGPKPADMGAPAAAAAV